MSYIALARKWRPKTFSQLVGQPFVNQALIKSLTEQRLHHAYLFTGTRGVGKTSIARLFAKALNCENGVSAEPCLQCDACIAIEDGYFVDLIEVDGASRTRVEDTRDLLENIQYAPTSGRFKIYLIDEVHMLSQHSFNALLKTLEEPPTHVKFLLATTDPQKLPVTVLSRCLQFHLKPLDTEILTEQLIHILEDEKLTYDAAALTLISQAARGSMRDALSILDQAIASCDAHLNVEMIRQLLGYTHHDYALQLIQALAQQKPDSLIDISRKIAAEGGPFIYVLEEMLNYFHQLSIYQIIPPKNNTLDSNATLLPLAQQFAPEEIQLFYQIALKGIEDIQLAPTLGLGFEMTLLRMFAFQPKAVKPWHLLQPEKQAVTASPFAHEIHHVVEDTFPTDDHASPEKNSEAISWPNLLSHLSLTGLALNAAENAEWITKEDNIIQLKVAEGHRALFTKTVVERIEQALTKHYHEMVKLKLHYEKAINSSPAQQKVLEQNKQQENANVILQGDPFFQRLQQEFSAELEKNSIAPVEKN